MSSDLKMTEAFERELRKKYPLIFQEYQKNRLGRNELWLFKVYEEAFYSGWIAKENDHE